MKGLKENFKSRKFKMGGYQTLVMVIVIVLVIILNLVVNKMNITVDLSSDQKYTLTEKTRELAKGIKDTVKMYYMCQDGSENVMIEKVLDQYNGLGNIEVIEKDPVIYPKFSQKYTDEEIQSNDVIVVNETNGKNKFVSSAAMLVQDFDYSTYESTYDLDAEGQLTAALQSVTAEADVKLYYTSGHNEAGVSESLTDLFSKSNIESAELKTASASGVPDDCDILMINAPQYDFSEEEYKQISDYLSNGGKAVFFLNAVTTEPMTNYNKLLADYGVDVVDGYVVDAKGALNQMYPTMLVPQTEEHDITADVGDTIVAVPVSKGMTVQSDVRSTLTVTPLLKTTDSAFSKINLESETTEKEDGDVDGPFHIGLVIKDAYTENTKGAGNATEIVVFGSGNIAASDFVATNQYGNRSVILNTISYLSGAETNTLAIPVRSLSEEQVAIGEGDRIFFTVMLVVILPLVLLVTGFAIWYRRRKN